VHRYSIVAIFVFAASVLVLLCAPGLALAAPDDEVPGAALALGAGVSGSVDSTDVADVYSLTLTAGEEVHIRCDPGSTSGGGANLHLLVPGVSSIAAARDYDEIIYDLSGGSVVRWWADYDYIPAVSGTYYLWVEWKEGVLNYDLSVERTSRAALALAPEGDDIPGRTIGSGSVTGVVSTLADPDDVFAVPLTAGRTIILRLIPLAPFDNDWAYAYLTLLDPRVAGLSDYQSHRAAGRVMAENSDVDDARVTAEIEFTPPESGTYYVWVEAGGEEYGYNFAYHLSVTEPGSGFADVPAGHPYRAAIVELASRGIILGFEDRTFRPPGADGNRRRDVSIQGRRGSDRCRSLLPFEVRRCVRERRDHSRQDRHYLRAHGQHHPSAAHHHGDPGGSTPRATGDIRDRFLQLGILAGRALRQRP